MVLMASLLRFTTPLVGRWFTGNGAADVLDFPFSNGASLVIAQLYPLSPASQVTGVTLAINGNVRLCTSSIGANPRIIQLNLGGDPAENAGAMNTLSVTATDDQGGNTAFSVQYFRMVNPGGATTTTTPPPPLPPSFAMGTPPPVKKPAQVTKGGGKGRGKK
jgi:hypothetical protein